MNHLHHHARAAKRCARGLRLTPLMLSMVCLGMTPALAQQLPTGFAPVAGNVSLAANPPAGTMNINQGSERAIAQWQTFSIGAGGTVNVAQPSRASVLLNRVMGNELSTIAGKLNANGNVYLVNPNGVLFSSGSAVSVGGLVASTLKLSNTDASFMAGGQLVFERDDGNTATVINRGSISTNASGGSVALMGAQVINEGSINVARGSAGLVSARKVTVDFDGDGLMRYTIPADSKATTALVENAASGSVTADGGRIAMLAASTAKAQVVNQSGVLRARSLESHDGEIVLGAGLGTAADNLNGMRVSGTVDASGGASGNGGRVEASAGQLRIEGAAIDASGRSGGQVLMSAHRMVVDANTNVGASGSGQAGTTDGRWTIASDQDITVSSNPAYAQGALTPTAPADGGSTINAGALGRTLDRSTSLTLQSNATRTAFDDVNGYSAGNGVVFDFGAQVTKTEGRDAGFAVDSARNIIMATGSGVRSSSGAINVDFNADAKGSALPAELPITLNGQGPRAASILMQQASIESNGGDIRFFGQSDAVNGRAVGGVQSNGDGFFANGIQLNNSLVSACAQGVAACSGGGQISLRGQGATGGLQSVEVQGGVGVGIYGTTLRSGSGAITLDGRGGLGASGVRTVEFGQAGQRSVIESGTGDVRITGSTRGWSGSDPVVVFSSDDGGGGFNSFGGGSGVTLLNTRITTGGGVMLEGTGADLTALANNTAFQSGVIGAASGNSASVGASMGVLINSTDITGGAGRQIGISGKAGSSGFTVSLSPTEEPVVELGTAAAAGVQIAGQFGQGAISTEGGRISIQGRSGSDVSLSYTDDSEGGPMTLLSTASGTGRGGTIGIGGRNILIASNFDEPTPDFIDVSGATGGGTISVLGSGIAINQNAGMRADTTGVSGNGGSIRVVADGDLRSYNSYSARGGAQGGNGGFVETSGHNIDLSGIRVDAAAPAGMAGTWLVDPFDITIQAGAASGSLPTLPFVALANSVIQDGDINAALNGGTSVAIGTGVIDATSPLGTITINGGVNINVDKGSKAVSFQLDASRDINTGFVQIQSSTVPLDVVFNAGQSGVTGSINFNGQILSNGGNVAMTALGNGTSSCAICLNTATIDTRVGSLDTNPGGNVSLTVPAPGSNVAAGNFTTAAIALNTTDILSSTGNVDITGYSQNGTGVRLDGALFLSEGQIGVVRTSTGNITISGIGAFSNNSANAPGHGVIIDNARVASVNGNIAVRGLRQAGGTAGTGVTLQNGAQVLASGTGDIELTGESQGGAAGLLTTASSTNGQGQTFPDTIVAGNRNVVLRASNDGSADAIVLGGLVSASQVLNLRPGGVNAANAQGADRTTDPIALLGAGALGFAISATEMSRLTAGTVVVGSNTHAGNIDVLAPMASTVPLTLQNGGGGNINLASPVSAPQLGLISGGNITQSAGATITAGTLLAQSTGGSVILNDPGNNVSANTLGGSAAGRFEFVNSGPLRVGPVSVTAFDAAGNLPQVQAATSMLADTLLIRTLSGSLFLDTSVGTVNGADLVAATTFQNAGGGSIGGAPWRVWADTWVGETRGGLAGSGPLPNYYHCAYLGLCTVSITPGDNHFVYAQQPSVTVNIGSFARNVGQPNPNFTYTLAGLILGDTGAGITGTMGTSAGLQSPSGAYPVFGTFTSAEGYAINVVPGTLLVGNVLPQPARFVDVLREEPTTYVYDRNIGQAPICLATGPLEGDRAQQGNDLLAREWSRVRTRPNLTSCVDTERNNGCADF
ncbi:filamentous hemagglutinin N-terminal domain-containing protein [Variovorax sp. OV329]|uniref:two-partner secretion domain-containing protein n=1 Tax=Variovorax sp. OV329 TaxID=1882825 RepID=UPI0008F111EB|nr:filamentous hemagglutinin N-terminal domain-containing protein [Variovorax sp. OV329]SFM81758.1 filamentous hemagglutinin family N-terminal domain-containing protein [Variovorax sp. OV329]